MVSPESWHSPARYEIKVEGLLRDQRLARFEGVASESEGRWTIITANVPDHSVLNSLINKVRDLGLPLVSIKRVEKNNSLVVSKKSLVDNG